MSDTEKLIADLRYWQEHSTSKGKLFKAAADEIESLQRDRYTIEQSKGE